MIRNYDFFKTCRPFFLLLIQICLITQAGATENATKTWTLKDCLIYGISAHPLIKMSQSSVETKGAAVEQSRAAANAKVNFRGGWSHRRDEHIRNPGFTTDYTTDSTSENLSVSKLVIDSGTVAANVKAARKAVMSAKMDKKARIIQIASEIKKSFYRVLRSQELLKIQKETLDGYLTHLKKVEGYVEVGTKPEYDITKAKVDVANARVELIKAKSTLKQAQVALSNSIGIRNYINIALPESTKANILDKFEPETVMKEAMSRPELKSLKLAIEAEGYKIKEAKDSLKPYVTANADYNWSGTLSPLNRNWNAGLSLNWSVFDGKLTDARVKSAKWQLKGIKASYENTKLNITSEVENAITNYNDAKERLEATKILVKQAKETMELAEARYDAGLGSPIEITDARVEYTRARGNNIIALYDSLIAITELDKVMGRLPPELKADIKSNVEIIVK